jgi:hypothetical protein
MVTFEEGKFVLPNRKKFYDFILVTKHIFTMDEQALNKWKQEFYNTYGDIIQKQSNVAPKECEDVPYSCQYISWNSEKVLRKIKRNLNSIISESNKSLKFQLMIRQKDYTKYMKMIEKLDCETIEVYFSWKRNPRIIKREESKNKEILTIYLETWDCVYRNVDVFYGDMVSKNSKNIIKLDIHKNNSTYKFFNVRKKELKYQVVRLDVNSNYYQKRREEIIQMLYTKHMDYLLSLLSPYDLYILENIIQSIIPK